MYRSIKQWRDLEDGHLYYAGDPFPHDGREISQERIDMLLSSQNKAGFAVIEVLPVAGVPEKVDASPAKEEEKPKRKRSARGGTK